MVERNDPLTTIHPPASSVNLTTAEVDRKVVSVLSHQGNYLVTW